MGIPNFSKHSVSFASLVSLLSILSGSGYSQTISPFLVGQNVWHTPGEGTWAKVRQAGLGSIRIGGIGYNNNMPGRATLLDWVKRIKGMGAEPILQIPHTWSAQQAGDLVRYFNRETGVRIAFWSIGNEPNLRGAVSVAAVADYYKRLAPAMRDVDPTIRILGPECAWYDEAYYKPLIGGNLDIAGTDAKGRFYIDGVTFHKYPYADAYSRPQSVADAARGMRANVESLLALMAAAEAKHGRSGEAKLAWGLTEFNISFKNPQPNTVDGYGVHSFHNGQYFAEVFGIGMQYGALCMNSWSIHESGGNRGPTDLGFLDANLVPRSTYYHMQMVGAYFRGEFLALASNLKNIRGFAARTGQGYSLMIMNMEETGSRTYRLSLGQGPKAVEPEAALDLPVGIPQSHIGVIAAQTTLVLLLSPTGALLQTIRYGIDMARLNQAPPVALRIPEGIRVSRGTLGGARQFRVWAVGPWSMEKSRPPTLDLRGRWVAEDAAGWELAFPDGQGLRN